MSVRVIQEKLDSYECQSEQEETNAIKEITQEVALAALARSGFFKAAAFQGGTCLRILYGLDRFSEDLDFVLQEPDPAFSFGPFLASMKLEFDAYGYQLQVLDRRQSQAAVRNVFLKDESIGEILSLDFKRPRLHPLPIKIKLEVDTRPPAGSGYEDKYLDFPFPFALIVQDPPSLFAGKIHALLCREYVKGRDWYDFVWYVGRKTRLNFPLLSNALDQLGPWKGQGVHVDAEWLLDEMRKKILSMDWKAAQADVRRFIKPRHVSSVELWSNPFFMDRLEKWRIALER